MHMKKILSVMALLSLLVLTGCAGNQTQAQREFANTKKIMDEDNLVSVSEFPHGYSLNQGRLLYYYGKHIFYNIPPTYPVTTLTFNLSAKKDEEESPIFSVYNNSLESDDETIQSWALDNFDFDMTWLSTEIKKVDWSIELTNPLSEYDFLIKKNGDSLII